MVLLVTLEESMFLLTATLEGSMPLLVVGILLLLLPVGETIGLLDLEEPLMSGVPPLQRRQLEERVEEAGKYCPVIRPWANGTLLDLYRELMRQLGA